MNRLKGCLNIRIRNKKKKWHEKCWINYKNLNKLFNNFYIIKDILKKITHSSLLNEVCYHSFKKKTNTFASVFNEFEIE